MDDGTGLIFLPSIAEGKQWLGSPRGSTARLKRFVEHLKTITLGLRTAVETDHGRLGELLKAVL